jgi:DNA polymerase-3 subunit beta
MKVTIASATLQEGLALCSGAAAARTPKVALQGVHITAYKDSVLLMSTDLEIGIRYQITEVEVEQEGEALVSVAKLNQIVRECTEEMISLEVKDNAMHLKGEDSHFQIFLGDAREFPPVPSLEGPPDFELEGRALRTLIDRTQFAAAKESTRYAIDGLLWEKTGDVLRIVATDGRRLASARGPIKSSSADGRVIVPSKAVSLFARVSQDSDEPVGVKFLSNQVLLKTPKATISSVLVEGHFPKYEDVIPTDCDKTIEANVPSLLSAVRRAAVLTSEDSKAIRMGFSKEGLLLTGRSPEQGEASIRVALEYGHEPLEIGFNPTFLMDILKVIDTDTVALQLKAPNRPGLFKGGEDFLYVVMPVNLSGRS